MMSPLEKRMLVYPWMIVWAYFLMCVYLIITETKIFVESDFVCFYSAAVTALSGNVTDVYDVRMFLKTEQLIWEKIPGILPWVYPPTFLLLIMPLAILPYLYALVSWLALTLTGYCVVVHKISPHRCAIGLTLAFPGTFLNLCTVQNGFLSALLLGSGLLLLERWPILAGICLGFLSYKPHLAFLVFIAIIASRMWHAVVAACLTIFTLIFFSIYIFGIDVWYLFYNTLPVFSQTWLNTSSSSWQKMQTIFAFAKLIGISNTISYVLQIIFSLSSIIAVTWAWYKRVFPMAFVILCTSILMATPYALFYDLTILGLAIAWYGWHCFQHGWLLGEKIVLTLAWFTPFLSFLFVKLVNIQITPIISLAIMILAVIRVNNEM